MSDATVVRQMGHGAMGGATELAQPIERRSGSKGRNASAGQPWVSRLIASSDLAETASMADVAVKPNANATAAIQDALNDVAALGGGTVALAGRMRLGNITVPAGVALVGVGNQSQVGTQMFDVFGTIDVATGGRLAHLSLRGIGDSTSAPVVRVGVNTSGAGPAVVENIRIINVPHSHAMSLVARAVIRRCHFGPTNQLNDAASKCIVLVTPGTTPTDDRTYDIAWCRTEIVSNVSFLLASEQVKRLAVQSCWIAAPMRGDSLLDCILGRVTHFVGNEVRLTTRVSIFGTRPVVVGNHVEGQLLITNAAGDTTDPVVVGNVVQSLDHQYPLLQVDAAGQALVAQNMVVGRRASGSTALMEILGGNHFVHGNILRQEDPKSAYAVSAPTSATVVHNDLRAAWATAPILGTPTVNLSGNLT